MPNNTYEYIGAQKYKDKNGNINIMYPVTKSEAVLLSDGIKNAIGNDADTVDDAFLELNEKIENGSGNTVTDVKIGGTLQPKNDGVVNLPAYPTVPTKTSQLTNDSGFKTTDNNTTYTFENGSANGTFKVTPSGGTAQAVSIGGLKSAAYTESSAYATSSQGGKADTAVQNITIGGVAQTKNDGTVDLPAYPTITYGTTDLVAGSSYLATGSFYVVYK